MAVSYTHLDVYKRQNGEWIYFDMVPEEHEVRGGAAEYTGRICVIGSKLNEEKIAELFGVGKEVH